MHNFDETEDDVAFASEEEFAAYVAKFKKKRKWMFIFLAIMGAAMSLFVPLSAIFGSPLPGAVTLSISLVQMVALVVFIVLLIQCKIMQATIKSSWRYTYTSK